jgi:hypothetical protein
MLLKLFSSLVLALVLTSCAPTSHAPSGPQAPSWHVPLVHHVLGVDPAFTGPERAALDIAVGELEWQTRGRVRLEIGDAGIEGDWFVFRQVIGDPQELWAREHFGAPVYAWTDPSGRPEVHLVADRHKDMHALTHTAMHEFLHLIGAWHVYGNAAAVMAPSTNASEAPLTLTMADKIVVAWALGCEVW